MSRGLWGVIECGFTAKRCPIKTPPEDAAELTIGAIVVGRDLRPSSRAESRCLHWLKRTNKKAEILQIFTTPEGEGWHIVVVVQG